MKKALRYSEAALVSLLATACSGGGSGSPSHVEPSNNDSKNIASSDVTIIESTDTTMETSVPVTTIYHNSVIELTEKVASLPVPPTQEDAFRTDVSNTSTEEKVGDTPHVSTEPTKQEEHSLEESSPKPDAPSVSDKEKIEEVSSEPEKTVTVKEDKIEEGTSASADTTEREDVNVEENIPEGEVTKPIFEESSLKPDVPSVSDKEKIEEVSSEPEKTVTVKEDKIEEGTSASVDTTEQEVKENEATEESTINPIDEKTEENVSSITPPQENERVILVTKHVYPTGEYRPKDPSRIFDEADRYSSQNGLIEKLQHQNNSVVNEHNQVHNIGVIDVDFSSSNDTGDAFLFTNGKNRLLLNQGSPRVEKGNKHSHGTMAAGVIALNNKNAYIYGYTADSNGMVSASNQYYDAAYERGIRIFNNSYGNTPWEERVKEKGWETLANHNIYLELAKWAAKDSIFVWAAGNEGNIHRYTGRYKHATTESHVPVLNDNARKGWITVAAVNWQETALMDYSSQIGDVAQNWGIAAQGNWDLFNHTVFPQGTSFAAPAVTAAVANVWDKFPWMSNHLVTQTILSTANKLGSKDVTTGPNKQIGWGVLNVERALKGPARFDKRLLVEEEKDFVIADFDYHQYADKDRLTWHNDIVGDAGFKKRGTGILYFGGKNSYTGDTVIEGGTLAISNDLTHSAVTIEKNGSLLVKNEEKNVSIGNSVSNKGSLDIYGQGATIQKDYIAERDSRTVIDIHTALLDIKGTADMNNSRILADIENVDRVPTQTENVRTILKAGNLINYNNFYTVSDRIAPYILVSKVEKQENEVKATYKRNQTANVLRSVGAVPRSAENAGANLDKVLDEVATKPNSAIQSDSVSIINAKPMSVARTVESLSAEIYSSSPNMMLNANRIFSQNVAERSFQSLQDEKSDVYAVTSRQSYRISQEGYASADVDGNQSYVGADKQTGPLLLGAAAYLGRQKADFERSVGSSKLHQQGGMIYAGYQLDNHYLLAQTGIAEAKNEIKRSILLPNETRRVETDVKSRLYHFYTELGHRIKFKQGEVSPFMSYQFDSIYQKAFNEGKNFGIQANRTHYNLNSYLLGVRAIMKFGDVSVNTTLSHRMTPKAENAFGFNARYIGAESDVYLQGISPAKYVTAAKLGLNYQMSEAFNWFGEYAIARQKGGERWQNISVGMKYRF